MTVTAYKVGLSYRQHIGSNVARVLFVTPHGRALVRYIHNDAEDLWEKPDHMTQQHIMGGSVITTTPDGKSLELDWDGYDYSKLAHSLGWDDNRPFPCHPPMWAQYMDPNFRFKVNSQYLTLGGDVVRIIQAADTPHYECVRGHDNIWRYNRAGDFGRTTGSSWDRLTNLIPVEMK